MINNVFVVLFISFLKYFVDSIIFLLYVVSNVGLSFFVGLNMVFGNLFLGFGLFGVEFFIGN